MSTKEEPGPFDGLERAEPDEPIFTLRAKDPHAAPLVHQWVRERREWMLTADLSDEKRELELTQIREAEEIAWEMEEWRSGFEAHQPAEKTTNYSGIVTTEQELAAKAKFDARLNAARRIDNSVAELTDASESISAYGFDEVRVTVAANVANLKLASEAVRPKRRSYAHLEGEE